MFDNMLERELEDHQDDVLKSDKQILKDEYFDSEKIEFEAQKIQDSLYNRRVRRKQRSPTSTGGKGSKSQERENSVVWDDED